MQYGLGRASWRCPRPARYGAPGARRRRSRPWCALPAHDLAAVQVQDQVQVEPHADHGGRQVGHVPAPHLRGRAWRCAWSAAARLGASWRGDRGALACPSSRSTRLKVDSLARYTPSSASMGTMRAGGTAAKRGSLATAQRAQRARLAQAHGSGASGAAACGLPSPAVRPSCKPSSAAGCACRCRRSRRPDAAARRWHARADVLGQGLAILEADHSSSPLLKIACTFFDSTSSAAVSASARSLRSNSRSEAP